jgi:nucleotide-binding universal stress UspA family protein
MSFNGYSAKEIAEKLDISTITVSNVLNSPLGKAYQEGLMDKMKDVTIDVRKELVSMNKAALAALNRLMDPKNKMPGAVQLGAAKDVLDRSGYKAPDKFTIDMTMQTKSDAEIDAEIAALEASIERVQIPVASEIITEIEEPITEFEELNNEEIENPCALICADFCEYEDNVTIPDLPDDFDPFHTIKESN